MTLRYLMAYVISLIVIQRFKIFLYNWLLGYKIAANARIGFRTIILVDTFEMGKNSRIGNFVLFCGPCTVKIGEECAISDHCEFNCPEWVLMEKFRDKGYERSLLLGNRVSITNNHYFDLVGGIIIHDRVTIAGVGSQFWTHGGGSHKQIIEIGEENYIGSSSLVVCAKTGSHTLLAAGSVVVKDFLESDQLLGGNPARIIRSNYQWEREL